MPITSALLYVALIALMVRARCKSTPVKTPRRILVLPLILIVVGYGQTVKADIASTSGVLIGIGAASSFFLGVARGRCDDVHGRDGIAHVRWRGASVMLFVAMLLSKLALDVLAAVLGASVDVVSSSLLMTFGLTLLGESWVLTRRVRGTGLAYADDAKPSDKAER